MAAVSSLFLDDDDGRLLGRSGHRVMLQLLPLRGCAAGATGLFYFLKLAAHAPGMARTRTSPRHDRRRPLHE